MKRHLIYFCNGDGGDWSPPTNKPLNNDVKNGENNNNNNQK